jgi:hypothetical protein
LRARDLEDALLHRVDDDTQLCVSDSPIVVDCGETVVIVRNRLASHFDLSHEDAIDVARGGHTGPQRVVCDPLLLKDG